MRNWRPVVLVLLPFATAYFISYLFRTINAVIAERLRADLGLGAADLGLLTSIYFLTFAALQLPLGIWLDRYGPRRVQSVLMLFTAVGSAVFSLAHNYTALVIGRALIGLGAGAALMSGIKAVTLWFPKQRQTLVNGWLVMLGALGAVTATAPAELALAWLGWRGMFGLLTPVTALVALIVYVVVPEPVSKAPPPKRATPVSLAILGDRHFWRLAPLSATCIGQAWLLQGLWAASWLADVEGMSRPEIVRHLFAMAVALSASALIIGIGADRLFQRGVRAQTLLALTATLFAAAQLALILRLPVPSYLVWSIVAGVGSATVLSFTILGEHVPREQAGRANGALSVVHIGGAFILQAATGMIVGLWTSQGGQYPAIAYQIGFAVNLALLLAALIWFVRPREWADKTTSALKPLRRASALEYAAFQFDTSYEKAARAWGERLGSARAQARNWRIAAAGSTALSALLGLTLIASAVRASVVPYVMVVDRLDADRAARPAIEPSRASDAEIAYFLARFIRNVRSLSTDPVVVRRNWLDAYGYVTDVAAKSLNDQARHADTFSKIGIRPVTADVIYVVRASGETFEIRWNEETYENGAVVKNERFTGVATIVFQSSTTVEASGKNPLGLYFCALNWSRDHVADARK